MASRRRSTPGSIRVDAELFVDETSAAAAIMREKQSFSLPPVSICVSHQSTYGARLACVQSHGSVPPFLSPGGLELLRQLARTAHSSGARRTRVPLAAPRHLTTGQHTHATARAWHSPRRLEIRECKSPCNRDTAPPHHRTQDTLQSTRASEPTVIRDPRIQEPM